MSAALSHRGALVLVALAGYAGVAAAHALLEVPSLELGHLFYLPIALLALAGGPMLGAAAGVLAAGLAMASANAGAAAPADDVLTLSAAVHGVAYVSAGALVGAFAGAHRDLALRLRVLAERDYLTGLLNSRAFEDQLQRRCARPVPFALVLGDLDDLKEVNDRGGHAAGNALLRRAATALSASAAPGDVVARVGGDEFAVLREATSADEAAGLCRRLESALESEAAATSFGWALHPADGGSAAALHRRAGERLSSSKAARKSREKVRTLLQRT